MSGASSRALGFKSTRIQEYEVLKSSENLMHNFQGCASKESVSLQVHL